MHPYLQLSEETAQALAENRPVLALESTIISHGMPYPQNVEVAMRVEQTVRDLGVVPATCAVLDGQLCAGLSSEQLEFFGKKGQAVHKVSRRDLPYLLSKKIAGATTVAATMIVAHQAGIRFFATGGIGGVHRGASESFDVSADLQELARTEVAVVSAGVKAILDIGLTLEYLETMGVPVLGYRTEDFPAFYNRKSGFQVDFRLDSPEEIADVLHKKWSIGLGGGAIIANPIPEADELDKTIMDNAIEEALHQAEKENIKGKAVTPFLLGKVKELTGGLSLESNIALVLNNARLGAEVAKAYSKV